MPLFGKKVITLTTDILRGLNETVWGGVEGVQKASTIAKTGLSGADAIIGVSHTLEDLACDDYVCAGLDIIGSASSTIGIVLGNIPATKSYTVVTGSVTVCCRSVRYYCKKYGTFWGCTVAAGNGVKQLIKIKLRK